MKPLVDMTTSEEVVYLRHALHECPEIAGDEVRTANVITSFLRPFRPDRLFFNLGGWGVAAVFNGEADEPTVMFRCELDAIPLAEDEYTHTGARYAHLCGHDGHMAMVAGLAPWLRQSKPPCRVVLLFQPAEETGEGALRVIQDPRFGEIKPDFAVALHNLPGFPTGTVVLRDGTFASSSVGLHITLVGHPSHAAEPEKALSPLACMCALQERLQALAQTGREQQRRLVTITHMNLGEQSFGVTPGHGVIFVTMRSEKGQDLQDLRQESEALVRECAASHGLEPALAWFDDFPETSSDERLVGALRDVCRDLEVPTVEEAVPFRWSEDFGHFNAICPSLFFGLGVGVDAPRLHQSDYRFPDEIIPTGVNVYHTLLGRISGLHRS